MKPTFEFKIICDRGGQVSFDVPRFGKPGICDEFAAAIVRPIVEVQTIVAELRGLDLDLALDGVTRAR